MRSPTAPLNALVRLLHGMAQHLWLGLTFRHPLDGLPQRAPLLPSLLALAVALAVLRFGLAAEVLYLVGLMLLVTAYTPHDRRPLGWLAIASAAVNALIVTLSLPATLAILMEAWMSCALLALVLRADSPS